MRPNSMMAKEMFLAQRLWRCFVKGLKEAKCDFSAVSRVNARSSVTARTLYMYEAFVREHDYLSSLRVVDKLDEELAVPLSPVSNWKEALMHIPP